jgi:hypothetical protein
MMNWGSRKPLSRWRSNEVTHRRWADAADECFLKKMGESESDASVVLRALQFLPRAWKSAGYACDGTGNRRASLDC